MAIETIGLLAISLGILIYSSDKLVTRGERIARFFKVNPYVLGITLIAVGTTIPELATGIAASVSHNAGLVWGNIIGSNIATIGFVLGLSILATNPFDIQRKFFKPDLLALMLFTLLFITFGSNGVFSPLEGAILVILFMGYLVWATETIEFGHSLKLKKELKKEVETEINGYKHEKLFPDFVVVIAAFIGVWLGAIWTVDHAVLLANEFQISQTIIGFTIIAIGTSLPNFFIALSALHHNLGDIFLGSIIGANIATIALVGGISSLIAPMVIPFAAAAVSYSFLITITACLFVIGWIHPHITKHTAFILLLIWIGFLIVELNNSAFAFAT